MTEDKNNLSQLPKGWIWTTVGYLYDIIGGGTPSTAVAEYWNGDIPWITSADIYGLKDIKPRKCITKDGIENSATNLVPEKSLIVVTRVGLGKVALTKTPICFSQDSQALVGNSSLVCPEYSLYYLSKAVQIFKYKHRGTTISGVTKKQLSDLSFPLPPFNEQHRIASKVEELFSRLDAGVESLRKVKAQLKRYRQAVLKYAFEGKLTEEWRKDCRPGSRKQMLDLIRKSHQDIVRRREESGKRTYGNLEPLQYEDLPQIPESWAWARFEEVIYVIDYRGRTPPFGPDGIPHLRSSNIRDGKIIWDDLEYVSDETYQEYMVRGLPEGSDLLFTTEAPLGEVAPVPSRKFSVAQRVVILRPMKDLMNPKFLLYQIMSERFRRRLTGRGTGTTVTGVSYRNLRQIEIVVPPLDEQEEIAQSIESRISITERIASSVDDSLAKAACMRSGILKKAFEGRLVPQDPTEEPAEKLLERIRGERRRRIPEGSTRTRNMVETTSKQMELVRYVK